MTKSVTPPSASGAAGPLFESQVGANYLLAMLRGAEPRGLPGFMIDRVKLQRAAEGHPLDDVIIDAHDAHGAKAVLEVQVKRSMTFAPSDAEFKAVVRQIAAVLRKPEFTAIRYELAIATEHTKRAVTGAYQEVLSWARKMQAPTEFFDRINRPGSGNQDMRDFVETLRANLAVAGAAADETTAWTVLRRLQIHVYDFNAPGSACETYARDRAADVLHPDDKPKARALWNVLITKAATFGAGGGDFTRESVRADLTDFRFEGDRRYTLIRNAIEEAAQFALVAMAEDIDHVVLGRAKRAALIRVATDGGRYVELRGEAGVGKSGLLRHFAEEVGRESRILVVAPQRIAKGGWSALRGQLGFDGTARELMRDLAADGGGWLFIDNVDFFTGDERTTVEDLMRAASHVPGVIVIVSARQSFGVEEPSWLPADAIARLGRAEPVDVGELDADEINELRAGAPRLYALLAPDHPAKAVTRNLFRLSRLARAAAGEPDPRTEADLAAMWWRTADGPDDATKRERARVLHHLGALSLKGDQVFDVSDLNDAAINALVRSETLRELRLDQMVFRHDVLREWAIANTLTDDAARLAGLPLESAGSPAQQRGLELAARTTIEKPQDVAAWRAMLATVTTTNAHLSWRRAVMLAPIRSEIVNELVPLLAPTWLDSDATLLRELIPLMMAVEVQSLRKIYLAAGLDVSAMPQDVNIPRGQGWFYVTEWLLGLGASLPLKALPEIVEFLAAWCTVSALYPDPFTAQTITQFKTWLIAIDNSNEIESWREHKQVFGGHVTGKELRRIEDDMRTTFALFATRAPDEVKAYLKTLPALKRKDDVYENLLKFRGTIAQAAPEELAAMTLDALVGPPYDPKKRRDGLDLDGALTHIDRDFLPVSPAQGPFFELLTHAPVTGLTLIRTLVDKAVAYHVRETQPAGYNVFIVDMPDGPRRFLWHFTYGWSRSCKYMSITCALMALEAWAHARVEAGDPVEAVIKDIIGPPDAPAAYLLVVVDIVLSHWQASRTAAVPFVASPDLLSTDLSRPVQENIEFPDYLGFGALQREPAGPKVASLKNRTSRHISLDRLLYEYAERPALKEERAALEALLTKARERLGPYEPGDNLSHPRLMAFHAINRINPTNYQDVEWEREDGTVVKGRQYVAPPEEEKHFAPMQEAAQKRADDADLALRIGTLIDRPDRSSPELADQIAAWARQEPASEPRDDDEGLALDQARVGAALITMRDGSPELRAANAPWAEEEFAKALTGEHDIARVMRPGMQFNPVAMAFAGRVFALQDTTPTRDDLRRILTMAAGDVAASRGAGPAAQALRTINSRLPRAVLRTAFAASVGVLHRYDAKPEAKAAAKADKQAQLATWIETELAWLLDGADEPAWPAFPVESLRSRERHYIRLGPARDDEPPKPKPKPVDRYVNHQTAAIWLRALWRPDNDMSWLRDLTAAYIDWTLAANGAGLGEREQVSETPREWNDIFFVVFANSLRGRSLTEVDKAITPILSLSGERFYDVTVDFVHALDVLFFNEAGVDPDVAFAIRRRFAEKLRQDYAWRHLRATKSDGVEMHLGPAGSVLFFNDHPFGQTPTCYLPPLMIDRSLPFTPLLQALAVAAPSPFVAIITMNWLEVAPRPEHTEMLLAFATAALEAYPGDRSFWVDHGIGRRICRWLDGMRTAHPEAIDAASGRRPQIETILAKLVAVGVMDARELELALQK